MNGKGTILLIILLVVGGVLYNSIYTIKETERAVLLKFGQVVNADLKPGLGFKIPVFNEIRRFDARVLGLDLRAEEYLTQEKKRLIVDSFVMWHIVDVKNYYTATGGFEENARRLIEPIINEGLRNQFGQRSVFEVVSGEREELMVELTNKVTKQTQQDFGIEVIDIRVKKIELPPTVSGAVYDRMRAERLREAQEHRSEGKELAEGIRADADRQQRVIVADAYRESEIIRGSGDAEAAAIYADAFGGDPEFYEFYRSLNAYTNTFQNKGDVLLVDPDSEFFGYLKNAAKGKN
jgi:membrane protease subunit HflC